MVVTRQREGEVGSVQGQAKVEEEPPRINRGTAIMNTPVDTAGFLQLG